MRVYLAGSYRAKESMKKYRDDLSARGFTVTSSWLDEPFDQNTTTEDLTPEERERYAQQDLRDIEGSDCLVQFLDSTNTRGGMHVEFGYAYAQGKKIIVVGTHVNIFHALPNVEQVLYWEDAIRSLERMRAKKKKKLNALNNVYLLENVIESLNEEICEMKNTVTLSLDRVIQQLRRDKPNLDEAIYDLETLHDSLAR